MASTADPPAIGGKAESSADRRTRGLEAEDLPGRLTLVVGLGNPGKRYASTRHNAGAMAAARLAERWDLPRPRNRFKGQLAEGRAGPGGASVALLVPMTFMNESGDSVGPARGSLKVLLERLIVMHDEIDLPFGEVRSRMGGGLAGHNGLKSVKRGLGSADFWRLRIGVGRPDSTDPEIVAGHVLSRFRESSEEVEDLIERAADKAESLVRQLADVEPSAASTPD